MKSSKISAQECIIGSTRVNYNVPQLFTTDYDIYTVSIINHMLNMGYDSNKMMAAICVSGSQNDLTIPIALCLRQGCNVNGNLSLNGNSYSFILSLSNNPYFASYYFQFLMFGLDITVKSNGVKIIDELSGQNKYYGTLQDMYRSNPTFITRLALKCRKASYVNPQFISTEDYCKIQVYSFVPPSNIMSDKKYWYDVAVVHAINCINYDCFSYKTNTVPYPLINKIIKKISDIGIQNRWLIKQLLLMLKVSESHSNIDGYQHTMLNQTVNIGFIPKELSKVMGKDIMDIYISIPEQFLSSLENVFSYVAIDECNNVNSYYIPGVSGGTCITPNDARKSLENRNLDPKTDKILRKIRALSVDYNANSIVIEYESLGNSILLTSANSTAQYLDKIIASIFGISCLHYLTDEHAAVTFCWIAIWSHSNNNSIYNKMMESLSSTGSAKK